MLRLLKWAVVAAALAAVVAFVPVGGRTVLARWRGSSGAADFTARTFAELQQGARRLLRGSPEPTRDPQARAAPRSAAPARPGQGTPPAEHHTEADRKALDAIVAEHTR
jgi:hypothetical protein